MNRADSVNAGVNRSTLSKPIYALPHKPLGGGFTLLDSVRVIDLTTSIAGPMATMLLADMGAEVVKIERPVGGDDARAWGPPFLDDKSLWFASVNRNKKSVALDYSKPEGLEILKRLIRLADVVVVNLPPRVARKLKVDAKTLRSLRPELIYASITGFGLEGERADWTCYDLIAEGYSGVMDLTGAVGGEPQKIGAPAADMLAGQDAAFAVVCSLFERDRTRTGRLIDISLVDSMTRFLACRIVPYLGSGDVPTRSGGKDSVIAVYQSFETSDYPITLGLGNDGIWQRFWDAVGQSNVASLRGMATNAERRERRADIVAMIAEILQQRSRSYWLAVFRKARVPAGPINSVDQVVTDKALLERGMFYQAANPGDIPMPQVGTGILLDGASNSPRLMPPRLGDHTDEVLRELLGIHEPELEALAAKAVTKRKVS
jgi:crotonobetainyl-CoA:carnitine CoA-transferase CaiB-like acyl-CoA transferase